MKLITKEIERAFAKQGDTSEKQAEDIMVIAKFFDPTGAGTWYAVEYDPVTRMCFGYVTGLGFDELGSFSIDELAAWPGRLGLKIERDRWYTPGKVTLRQVMDGAKP